MRTNRNKQIIITTGASGLAWMLLFTFCTGLFAPTIAHAGGPTQPEVQGFTPIGVSDMVDPFTGDFNYNIPLMDVEGYPINIAYSSGIGMDQEASWVGLGWNLNMGAIVRSMRGLPDDFDGDLVTKTQTQKPNVTVGLDLGAGVELFGNDGIIENATSSSSVNLSANLGLNYNNYNGLATSFSFGPSYSFLNSGGGQLTAGFSLSGSSENGASFSPSLSYSKKTTDKDKNERNLKGSIGSSMNSRAGLQQLSYGLEMTKTFTKTVVKDGVSSKKATFNGNPGASGAFNLGLHQYSPTVGPSTRSINITGSWKVSATIFGGDGSFDVGLSYSRQAIPAENRTFSNPAYGYFNLENGQNRENALMDFNRDNDGSFTIYTPDLPSAHLTNDLFSIQAQGISGSYRGFRNEVGYVFDPVTTSSSTSGNVGIETGFGNAFDFGIDIGFNVTSSRSGAWTDFGNQPKSVIRFENQSGILENYAIQEANERSVETDMSFSDQFMNNKPQYFPLEGPNIFPILRNKVVSGNQTIPLTDNDRDSRLKRNQLMTFLTIKDLRDSVAITPYDSRIYSGAKDHHIGEITQLGTDGRRYIFGLPAYNYFQEDVNFSIGNTSNGSIGQTPTNDYDGIITLSGINTLASQNNDKGRDNYYSSTTTPAYAHSFMLTSVISDDYVDSDGIPGPSDNDLGSYVKFDYDQVKDYSWRTPIQENSAFYNEGLKTDLLDDKASFIYGQKELWYVKAVETKNYIAVFVVEDRQDGGTATSRNGGVSSSKKMKLLRKIVLYAKPEYEANGISAIPLQEVNFVYNYTLCLGYPLNASGGGKLTLKEIFFTYQGSFKMKRSSYKFDYNQINPSYNMKAVDRWGTYKASGSGIDDATSNTQPMTNSDFPYTIQSKTSADINAGAWCLSDIFLPSGGKIKVDYESDDYAYVQHLEATQMFRIAATSKPFLADPITTGLNGNVEPQPVSLDLNENGYIFFEMNPDFPDVNQYASANQPLYFRCLVDFLPDNSAPTKKYEYVSGYGTIESIDTVTISSVSYGRIKLKGEQLKDNSGPYYNPITKAAILFGRMHLSNTINDINASEPDGDETSLLSYANSIANAFTSLQELFTGPNVPVYNKGKGQQIVVNKSFIRLLEPSKKKLGGGVRVKQIRMYDNWDYMVRDNNPSRDYEYNYGQQFKYELEDGTSSGVASYEPQIGGDENPWHKPTFYNNKYRLAPDENLYIEDPIMESLFPSPSVGYSRVVISDLKRTGVTRTATGKVVKEFYTAKDFPTIVRKTDVSAIPANSFLPLLPKYQFLTASQGFTIEMNDMHGKPKSEAVYAQSKTEPISTVNYNYLKESVSVQGKECFQLKNSVTTIDQNGSIQPKDIGVKYEGVADFRESNTQSIGGSVDLNLNAFFVIVAPAAVPTIWPSVDISFNQFRSATMNKIVNRFGIMDRTSANQDGSIVETNNLAYDAETGEVLITQTTTNFNDKVYSMNYPAYWKYGQMGLAYENIGFEQSSSTIASDGFVSANPNPYVEGDELKVEYKNSGGILQTEKGWVVEKNGSGIKIHDESGNPISGTSAKIKIIRSGRRNRQMTSMASLTSLENPLNAINSNQYLKVLNAGAVEFKNEWGTYCDCFMSRAVNLEGVNQTTNPYVTGSKGNWRPIKSYTHLTNRSQTEFNKNTNIRRDGIFTSYTPYYKLQSGDWVIDGQNWTYVSEVTKFSPNGMTLETQDALGRFSASQFGFNNTLTTAVAANTKLSQMVEGSFEDRAYSNCQDQGLFSKVPSSKVVGTEYHTGRKSIRLVGGESLLFGPRPIECERQVPSPLSMTQPAPTTNSFIVEGGQIPYMIQSEVVSGSGDATLSPNGEVTFNFDSNNYFEVLVTIIDSNNSKLMYQFKSRQTAPTLLEAAFMSLTKL